MTQGAAPPPVPSPFPTIQLQEYFKKLINFYCPFRYFMVEYYYDTGFSRQLCP